jgi:hypothetical protein
VFGARVRVGVTWFVRDLPWNLPLAALFKVSGSSRDPRSLGRGVASAFLGNLMFRSNLGRGRVGGIWFENFELHFVACSN